MKNALAEIERLPSYQRYGRVAAVQGLMTEVGGLQQRLSIGSRCRVEARGGRSVTCEVTGFRQDRALLMSFGSLEGVGLGCKVSLEEVEPVIYPDKAWLGRIVNAMGQPIDGRGPLPKGERAYSLRAAPPPAHTRRRVGERIDLGVRALNTFATCCRGQRMGIFAGSGVGKSILLSMLARYTASDVTIIGLVGERGREVQEFIEDDLGPEGLARSVVVVATSDESPVTRRQAAYLTLTLSEYFRDLDNDVLCLIDSITRFATAQREIGLSNGEPPASKGFTPTVFSEIPKLLERAGPGAGAGTITGLFTVLVEGDDLTEPVSDTMRATLDGHVVLSRRIAERDRYPAIDVLRSVSRTMPQCNSDEETALITRARKMLSVYEDMEDLVRIGAYRRGTNKEVDDAIHYHAEIEQFLAQAEEERCGFGEAYQTLSTIFEEGKSA